MASVRTFTLPHYEAFPVHVALFKDVTNAAFLRSQLLEANPDFDYAFLDASMILSPAHLLSATFLALHAHQTSRSKTRTPHSELVFRLSPNNNIGESYRKFGINDSSTCLIAVKLPLSPSTTSSSSTSGSSTEDGKPHYAFDEGITSGSVSKHLGAAVQGTSVPIGELGEELGSFCEVDEVRKVYKLGAGDAQKKGKKGAVVNGDAVREKDGRIVDERKEMESVILGIMALKGS